jgi:uncharacterized repeat protein (TIGR03803 family)
MKKMNLLIVILTAAALATTGASAQTLTTLYSFAGPPDGAYPGAGLTADASGNLYGTTGFGGDALCFAPYGCGTVFKLTPSGTETVLYSFTGAPDGEEPDAGLTADASGNLYGSTYSGGSPSPCYNYGSSRSPGCGTVFEVTPSGTETVLHSFTGDYGSDGQYPYAPLIVDASGNFYGTTYSGGAGYGTVFKVTPSRTETILHSFTGADGAYPFYGLTADGSGNLYGTTPFGGTNWYGGTVFKLTPSGTETVLHSFTGAPDGEEPSNSLIVHASGNLYGTTRYGGAGSCVIQFGGCGTVFNLSPSGTETVLYSFTDPPDGVSPYGLIADAAGNLYGTTAGGGANVYYGTVFKLTPSGTETVLYSFTGGSDGSGPLGTLIADASGNLYGTTISGGANGYGTVFKLSGSGFVPPVRFAGVPGSLSCVGVSVSTLAHTYGSIAAAAKALGYRSVSALQNAVAAYCGGS